MSTSKLSFADELNKVYLPELDYNQIQKLEKPSKKAKTDESPKVLPSSYLPGGANPINSPSILLVRGFLCFLFDVRTSEFRRCADTIRDRAYFETVAIRNEKVYAISTFSNTAAGIS